MGAQQLGEVTALFVLFREQLRRVATQFEAIRNKVYSDGRDLSCAMDDLFREIGELRSAAETIAAVADKS